MAALYGFHFKWIYLLDLFCLIYVTFCTCEIDDDVHSVLELVSRQGAEWKILSENQQKEWKIKSKNQHW